MDLVTNTNFLEIQNCNIYDAIKKCSSPDFDIYRTLNGRVIEGDQYVCSYGGGIIVSIDKYISVPMIKNAPLRMRYRSMDGIRGVFFESEKRYNVIIGEDTPFDIMIKLCAYVPFDIKHSKKISIIHSDDQFIYADELKHNEDMYNVGLDDILYYRDRYEVINDYDRIVYGSVSPKFDRDLASITRYHQLLSNIKSLLYSVKDSKYIIKLMKTANQLLVPNDRNPCETSKRFKIVSEIEEVAVTEATSIVDDDDGEELISIETLDEDEDDEYYDDDDYVDEDDIAYEEVSA